MYVPNNDQVFTAAFAGCLSGITASGRNPTDTNPSDYLLATSVAGAFAAELDTLWGLAPATLLDVNTIQEAADAVFSSRTPLAGDAEISATWQGLAAAIIAIVNAGTNYYTAEGIVPPPIPGGGGPVVVVGGLGTTTLDTNAIGAKTLVIPDIQGQAVVQQDVTGQIFMGLGVTTAVQPSNAGMQYSTITANRAQIRFNQYGANTAGPGATGFKSRGVTIGALAGVVNGDLLYRITAIGVAPNNVDVPLAATVSIQVPAGFVPAAQNYVPTEYEVALVPLAGPLNGKRVVQVVSSEGETQTLRGIRAGGPGTLPTALTAGTLWSSGTGDPNGVVTGSPGDLWSRTDGGAGTTLYVKESGVATTAGWVGK